MMYIHVHVESVESTSFIPYVFPYCIMLAKTLLASFAYDNDVII